MRKLGGRENVCGHKEAGIWRLAGVEEGDKKMMPTFTTVMTNPLDVEDANDGQFIPLVNLATWP